MLNALQTNNTNSVQAIAYAYKLQHKASVSASATLLSYNSLVQALTTNVSSLQRSVALAFAQSLLSAAQAKLRSINAHATRSTASNVIVLHSANTQALAQRLAVCA